MAARRWYVLGLREVGKAVRLGRAKLVVVAPNIEPGLDDMLAGLLERCGAGVVWMRARVRAYARAWAHTRASTD